MLKTLRRKFIVSAMAAFTVVLILILAVINTMNYFGIRATLITRLDMVCSVIEERGELHLDEMPELLPDEDAPPIEDENGGQTSADTRRGNKFGFFGIGKALSKEAEFDSRFFTVTLTSDGEVTDVYTGRIAAVDEKTAAELAQEAADKGKTKGMTGEYLYKAAVCENGGLKYTFLDCSRELDAFSSFLTASALTALGGLTAVFVLLTLFSGAMIRPMAESYEKQKRFITDASHELKTPLAVINAANEVTEMESGETEWTRSISKQISRLTLLTDKLVMLSRMDEESYKPTTARFDLSAAVLETAQSFEAVAQHKNKRYEIDVEPGVSYDGDENALRQLVSLLVDNAMKYSDEGGHIGVSLKRGKNTVLRVTNTVDEIKKGNNEVLFERFYRADSSRNSSTGGHGIGLSVAKAIVLAHKGKITAISPDGRSLVITATL